jgi:lipid-A-disaccharide synthase-like uncharacterized protein
VKRTREQWTWIVLLVVSLILLVTQVLDQDWVRVNIYGLVAVLAIYRLWRVHQANRRAV